MNYNELIQLYFERANSMQAYWNLYVIIVGGLLAFSSMRKQPAAVTTALVSILFALFAYKNLDAMHDVTAWAGPPQPTRNKCEICSSRLLLRPRTEACVQLTSPAIFLQ